MAAVRKDGEYVVYVIQTRSANYRGGEWYNASLDHFGTPPGFSASSECWQTTGIDGTFDRAVGLAGLSAIANKHPGVEFRLAQVNITQKTAEVASMKWA